jgi:hypothetical protein
VIGGRASDVSTVVDFATARSVYAEALVMIAIEENIVLVVPSGALARAVALIPAGHQLGVDVLLDLPCTIVDALDTTPARAVGTLLQQCGQPGLDVATAHVVHCARQRGWPVVTNDPEPLLTLDNSVEIESLS